MFQLHALSQASKLVADPDRRRSIRVEPPVDSPLPAQLKTEDGTWTLSTRSCTNVGLGGVAVRLDPAEADRLKQHKHMQLTLHLTGGVTYVLRVRVCHVNEMAPGESRPYQVGLQFMPAPYTCAAVVELYGYLSAFTKAWQ
jgi:c-di-GMP-binding flagellar brake protein YcgR